MVYRKSVDFLANNLLDITWLSKQFIAHLILSVIQAIEAHPTDIYTIIAVNVHVHVHAIVLQINFM